MSDITVLNLLVGLKLNNFALDWFQRKFINFDHFS